MAIKTQGTRLFTIDPDSGQILVVGCITSVDGIDTSVDQIETTCLDADARTYVGGMPTPGNATFGINFDPADDSHVRLHELKVAGATLHWAIGFSDDDAAPTVGMDSAGDDVFELPTTRSWIQFDGYMSSYPFTFALNAVVQSTVGIQISGEPSLLPKVTP